MRETDIIVVGCGIGGAATALALARQGITVRVLERAAEIAEVGAGLQVGPNAMRILEELKVSPFLTQKAVLPDRAVMRDLRTGLEIVSIDFGNEFRSRYQAPYAVMHRGDLLSALLKACQESDLVTIESGREVVEISQDEDSVRVVCANGRTYTGAGVIGADGMRSRVREYIFGQHAPLASRYVIYRGTVPRTDAIENAVSLLAAADHHVMHYPIRGGELVNVVFSFKSESDVPGGEKWGTVEELHEVFSDAIPAVRALLDHIDTSHRWVQFDRDPQPGWSRGRVVLMGDAAHPTHQYLAQGACQAMEDAVVMAESISGSSGDLPRAFEYFEARRFTRTSAVQRGSRFWGELSHVGGEEAAQRDALLSTLAPTDYRYIDWLYTLDPAVKPPVVPPSRGVYESI